MTSRPSDPLLLSTVRKPLRERPKASATLPTLTVIAHPDLARLGERASLKALLVGGAIEVSRAQPLFHSPWSADDEQGPGAPLLDPHVSRKPLRLLAEPRGDIRIEAPEVDATVDGEPLHGARLLTREQLAVGVVIELSQRVVLLLHLCSQRPLSRVPLVLGQSDAVEDLRRELLQVADLDTPVLLRGETGTGKELAAAVIHQRSTRSSKQYVAINMAAVPEAVAVSTLFGHARGAFTGAHQRHQGFFEQASGGTLLLDEIGETPENVQPILLRAVETGRILPLGEERERAVDIRFIAATDADLERGLADQSFSAALLHRLAGYEIHLPPLRARREDIGLLLVSFMQQELRSAASTVSAADLLMACVVSGFLSRLVRDPLPGNVRQLRNIARHMVISNRHVSTPQVTAAVERQLRASNVSVAPSAVVVDAGITASGTASPITSARSSVRPGEIDDAQLLQALRESAWSPNRAAAKLGIPTGTLHDLMRRSPNVRRAADLSDDEVTSTLEACGHDLQAAANQLCVSERALRITLKQRGLLAGD